MTDRLLSLTVILEAPTRTDDAQALMDAIAQLRGVLQVRHGEIHDMWHDIAVFKAKGELRRAIQGLLD